MASSAWLGVDSGMGNQAPEDLLVAAHQLDPDFKAKVNGRWLDPDVDAPFDKGEGWRIQVPPILRRLWGRLDYETRVAVFVTAASEPLDDWPDPNAERTPKA